MQANWRALLDGASPLRCMPKGLRLEPSTNPKPAYVDVALTAGLSSALSGLATQAECTTAEVLLAAFKVLLFRYTAQEDLVVGWLGPPERESDAGDLRGVLPVRTAARGDRGFQDYLVDVREASRIGSRWGCVANLADVLPHEALEAFPYGAPVSFEACPTLARVNGEPSSDHASSSPYAPGMPLSLNATRCGDGVGLRLSYDGRFYHSEFIGRMAEHYQRLIESAITDPATALEDLQLMSADEEEQVRDWSVGERVPTQVNRRHVLFQDRARQTPDRQAVVCDGVVLTYRDLDNRSNQLAHYLRELGVGANVPVGVALARSADIPVTYLGILKAGGVVFPIAAAAAEDRLRSQLDIVSPAVVIASDPVPEPLQQDRWPVLRLDEVANQLAAQPSNSPEVSVSADQLAFLMATSGSTGRPRIVKVPVGYRPSSSSTPQAQHHLLKSDSATTFTLAEIMRPLLLGGTLYVAPRGSEHDPWRLAAIIGQHRLTHLLLTPSQLRALLEVDDLSACRSLESVNISGEPLSHDLKQRFFEKLDATLVNMYGCTEAPGATTHECSPDDEPCFAHVGQPLPGMEVFVLDAGRRLCPVGVPGEVYLGGRLAAGYLNDPEATAERFVAHPFDPAPDARLFRTGDLGRWLPGGQLEILGRRDGLVKVRGNRVELGEVEARLRQHRAVADCVVLLRNDQGSEQRLVAYWTPQREGRVTTTDLRRHLSETLPNYMVPSAFLSLQSIPLTKNGKVDRRSLPAPDAGRPDLATEYVPAGDAVEAALVDIWREVLGVEEVGVNDSFLELGGDSLKAALVVSRVIRIFGVEVPVQFLLGSTTLAELAATVGRARQSQEADRGHAPRERVIPRRQSRGPCKASHSQRGFWFRHEYEADAPIYNMPTLLSLEGPLEVGALESAVRALVERHEALRTILDVEEGELRQDVLEDWTFVMQLIDLRDASKDPEVCISELVAREASRRFDLASDLMIRATLLRLTEDEHRLLLVTHHIATDQWSIGILIHELAAEYEARVAGRPSSLPELPIQYADYSVWEQDRLEDGGFEKHVSYWKEELGGPLPVLRLPTDKPRPALQTFAGARLTVALSPPLTRALNDLARDRGTTLFAVLMAAFQTFICRYSGETDVIVGFPIASRRRVEAERLVGNLINTLAVRMDFSEGCSFDQVLRQVHEKVLGAYAHQDLPFTKLVETLAPERDPSRSPVFDVMLDFGNVPKLRPEFSTLGVRHLPNEDTTSLVDLSLYLREVDSQLIGSFEYKTDLFDAPTVARIASHFEMLLEAVVSDPETDTSGLPLMSESEQRQVTQGFNETARDWPDGSVHGLFESQARRTPDAIAVEDRDGCLTYRELDRKADELAAHLLHVGVKRGDLVGICMERSSSMVTGVVGILKSGAAYVPLDPTFPAGRLSFMATDSNTKVVVSESDLAHRFPDLGEKFIALDDIHSAITETERMPAEQQWAGEQLAYVTYTSGSTGKPKGVRVPHGCVINFLRSMLENPGLTAQDVMLAVTTLSFDISVLEIFVPLSVGGRVVVADAATAANGKRLAAAIEASGATVMQGTPATWLLLLDAGWTGHSLTALCGGESLSPELAGKLLPRVSRLWNMYGPTETTVWSTCGEITDGSRPITVGRPIANTQIYVLDSAMRVVPIGVQGEVYIGGAGVTAGYLNRDTLTNERFVPSPFDGASGERLYRTGDLGRWLEDGRLEIHGRRDRQVKVRGHRIEPGEIEYSLARHPSVQACAVTARTLGTNDLRLVAYVVYDSSALEPTVSEIRRFLRDFLPNHMVPGVVVPVDAIPRTPNGKVDYKTLPDPFASSMASKEFVPPSTDAEKMLAEIWCDVLEMDRVGREDNFFELGGHSLLAVRAVYLVEERTGYRIDPRKMFFQTLAQIAAAIPAPIAE
jgi:amino acid adenylation domain-containing protein